MSNKMTEFFKGAFEDMKESAKAQHEVDKASFAAAQKRTAEAKTRTDAAKK